MAENVGRITTADASSGPAFNTMFANTSFWVGHKIPQRTWLIDKMRNHGATIVATESQADICLIDDAKGFGPYLNGDYFSFRFIEDSIRKGIQQPLERYRVSASSQTEAIQGRKGITNKRTRTKFTEQDDRILYETVMPVKNINGAWRGLQIYKVLAQKYPHHTYQSWRSRFIDHLQYRDPYTNRPFARSPEPSQVHERVAPEPQRSPKRQRLQEPENSPLLNAGSNVGTPETPQGPPAVPAPSQQSGQTNLQSDSSSSAQLPTGQECALEQDASMQISTIEADDRYAAFAHPKYRLLPDPDLTNLIFRRGFSLEQADSLYRAVPLICDTEPERIDGCWNEMALVYEVPPIHPLEEWKLFWSEVILPAYMKRNGLSDKLDLQNHIRALFEHEKMVSTPNVKIEQNLDSRTPEDVQRGRELARACAEAELQLSSDEEEDGIDNDNEDDNRILVRNNEKRLSSVATAPGKSCLFHPPSPPVPQSSAATVSDGTLGINQRRTTKVTAPQTTRNIQPSRQSPKKKLFGRSLHTENAASQNSAPQRDQVHVESQVRTEKVHTAPPASSRLHDLLNDQMDVAEDVRPTPISVQVSIDPPQSSAHEIANSTTLGHTNVTEFLPRATQQSTPQELPESGQGLPKSVSTSQSTAESSHGPSAKNLATDTTSNQIVSPKQGVEISPNEVGDESHAGEGYGNVRINLVDEDVNVEDEPHSEKAASDTGSEFMMFDEEPERSQLWEDPPLEDTAAQRDRDENATNKSNSQSLAHHNKDIYGVPTELVQSQGLEPNSDWNSGEQRSNDLRSPVASRSSIMQRPHQVETQDLFQATFEEDPTLLDVPPPAGGWEELEVDETEYEEFGTIMRTTESSVELDDEDTLDSNELHRNTTSYSSGESATLSSRLSMEKRRTQLTPQNRYHSAVIDISSDSFSDTESTVSSIATHSTGIRAPTRANIGRDAEETETETDSAASSESEDSPPKQETRIADLQNWFSVQRTRYITLPNPVFHRLASAAAQAATLNLPTAALVLRIMMNKYTSSETARRQQCNDRKRPFKPKANLTDEEARSLVPDDTWGVWTIADDKALLSRTVEGVKEAEVKHGVEGTRKRSRFLRARYAAHEAGSGSVGGEVARQVLREGKGTRHTSKAGLRDMVI